MGRDKRPGSFLEFSSSGFRELPCLCLQLSPWVVLCLCEVRVEGISKAEEVMGRWQPCSGAPLQEVGAVCLIREGHFLDVDVVGSQDIF